MVYAEPSLFDVMYTFSHHKNPSHLQGASLPATAYKTGHIIKITGKEKFWEWNFFPSVLGLKQDGKKKVFDLEELMGFWLENTIFEM